MGALQSPQNSFSPVVVPPNSIIDTRAVENKMFFTF